MKTRLFVLSVLFIAALMVLSVSVRADEVIVPEGPAIYNFIMGDTTSTGERTVPGRIYKLERGKLYIVTETLEIDFDFYLIADDDDPNNPTRPPMLVRGVHPDGSLVDNPFNFTGDGMTVKFENLIFQGVPMDGKVRNDWAIGLAGSGTDVHLEINKCVFNGWTYTAMDLGMLNLKLYITNCIFRNMVQPVHPFGGQVSGTWNAIDTLLFTNNTYFNCSSYIVLPERDRRCNYIRFDHNTVYTTMVNPFFVPAIQNAEFTNNILYGILALGQAHDEIPAGWYGWDNVAVGIMNYDTMSVDLQNELGMTEAQRRIVHKNNVWYVPQKIKDYWAAYQDSVPIVDANGDTTGWTVQPLAETPWMNANTQAMFDDDVGYPNFIDENTMNADPGFNAAVEVIVDSVVAWAEWWRGGLGWDEAEGPPRQYDPTGAGFNLPWPLPEVLTYSNSELAAASTEGLHLGDLNWYPEDKAIWEQMQTSVAQKEQNLVPQDFKLFQNYPNPFNPETQISFNLNKSGHVKLAVYNMLGQKVRTLLDKEQQAGQHRVTWDGTNDSGKKLCSGIYYYRLEMGQNHATRKMLLLK